MITYFRFDGSPVRLGSSLGAGGEGEVFEVANQGRNAAKIYATHQRTPERFAKLRAMAANPPADPTRSSGHVSLAWPESLVFDAAKQPVGVIMPLVERDASQPLYNLYNSRYRLQNWPEFSWRYLMRAARNMASLIAALHEYGYVLGDLNESNIFVNSSAQVTILDCDSMQVRDPDTEQVFRCTVGKPEYTPPELQGRDLRSVDRTPQHDDFGLAVLVFQLLMEGIHPFMGVWQGSGNPPTLQENIGTGASPYTQPERIARSPVAPPFEMLSPELRALFLRCFGEGLTRPERRPSAQDWADALEEVERRLTHCGYNRQHVYGNHLQLCPWCDRIRDGFPDPFPSASRGASIAAPVLPRPVANVRTVTVATQPLPSATAAAVPATQVRAPQRLARSAAAAVPARQAETRSRRRGAFVLVGAVAALIAVAWALPHFSDGTLASPRPVAATPTVTSFWVSNHRLAEMWSQALRTATEQNFGMTSQQFCVFEVRRQEGNRFFVFNPYTNNYFWIDADAVGKIGVPEHHPGPKPDQQNCAPEVYDD